MNKNLLLYIFILPSLRILQIKYKITIRSLYVLIILITGRHITVCTLCSSQLYVLKWTAQWNWKYWVISRLVPGIKTKDATKSKLSSSIQYWEIVGKKKYRRLPHMLRAQTTLHSLQSKKENVRGPINDISLIWLNLWNHTPFEI
jgi:hypothetical protein